MLRILASIAGSFLAALAVPQIAWAQTVPQSFVASPDVYKVIAENEQYRIVAVTWKPGQRDNWHAHGPTTAVYNLTDCTMRAHLPDGRSADSKRRAGDARIGVQAPSHSLENIGKSECRLVIFEPK